MSRYRLSEPAERDLEKIAEDFAEISEDLSLTYERRFRSRFELLAKFPLQCAVDARIDGETRVALVKPFLILYLPTESGVEIVRVIHGSRDLHAVLGDE